MIYDFIVVGSGISGLYFSIYGSLHGRVLLLTKENLDSCNTNYAQGGIAAVLSKEDSYRKHIRDTMRAGVHTNRKRAVKFHVKMAPKFIHELIGLGVKFEHEKGRLKLTKEGSHSERRIVYNEDLTGKEIEKVLVGELKGKDIEIRENCMVVDIIRDENRAKGVLVLEDKLKTYFGKTVILATGGLGQVYSNTTNPKVSTGDGFAIAKRAGARLKDMEFVQFHPTKFFFEEDEPFLISETLRGEGGILKNIKGKAFMRKYHKLGDLAPRDVVARAIYFEMKKHGSKHIYLDVSGLPREFITKRFPNIYRHCKKYNIDITKDPIPVIPSAHYICGGVETNLRARTALRGLYAIGEVAYTGLNGANRLASNSMMEGMVFGKVALKDATRYCKNVKINETELKIRYEVSDIKVERDTLRELMWKNVGIIRNRKDLWAALKEISRLQAGLSVYKNKLSRELIEYRNMLITSKEIVKAALRRKRSIGCHYVEKNR